MTAAVLRISGIAVIGVIASVLLKDRHRSLAVLAVVTAAVIIGLYSIQSGVWQTVESVKSFSEGTSFSQYSGTMLKALGIGYITVITESICRDAGENGLAQFVELGGRIQLLLLSLPLIGSLLAIAAKLL